ncbi:hypothetical protein SAMN05446589_9606 [Streptomyces sp. OV198]|jgi:hypothetical protein|nr:hypothetical protein SAMN05446589_9606 [Streptomyces sp. OV198]
MRSNESDRPSEVSAIEDRTAREISPVEPGLLTEGNVLKPGFIGELGLNEHGVPESRPAGRGITQRIEEACEQEGTESRALMVDCRAGS